MRGQAGDSLQDEGIGGIVAPNFAVGAVLMMHLPTSPRRISMRSR